MALTEDVTTQALRLGLVIVDLPQFTIAELRHRTGTNESTIRGFLHDLRSTGGLEELESLPSTGRGRPRKRYRLTSSGESSVQRRNADLATAAARRESSAVAAISTAAARKQLPPRLANWLEQVLTQQATGLHLTRGSPPLIAAAKQMTPIQGEADITESVIEGMAEAVMTPSQVERFHRESELQLAFSLRHTRFLTHLSYPTGGLAMRFEPVAPDIPTFSRLTALALDDLWSKRSGLVVVGGLDRDVARMMAGVVDLLNETRFENIVTVEDPAVFLHRRKKALVSQFEVGFSAATATYFKALEVALREAPTVLAVEDLTDPDALSMAVRLAGEGRLVIGGVSAPDMSRGLQMLIEVVHNSNLFRSSLTDCLLGVIWQASGSAIASRQGSLEATVRVADEVLPWLRRVGRMYEVERKTIVRPPSHAPAARDALRVEKFPTTAELNETYLGKIVRVVPFGAFVEILPGTDGLLHVSEMANHRIQDVHSEVREGDQILVKVVAIDPSGKIRLSRKALLPEGADAPGDAAAAGDVVAEGGSREQPGDDRGGGQHQRPDQGRHRRRI